MPPRVFYGLTPGLPFGKSYKPGKIMTQDQMKELKERLALLRRYL